MSNETTPPTVRTLQCMVMECHEEIGIGEPGTQATVAPPYGLCRFCEAGRISSGRMPTLDPDRPRTHPAPVTIDDVLTVEDEEPDVRPRCENCDGMEFSIGYSRPGDGWFDAESYNSTDDETIWVDSAPDGVDVEEIACANCGSYYNGPWEWS